MLAREGPDLAWHEKHEMTEQQLRGAVAQAPPRRRRAAESEGAPQSPQEALRVPRCCMCTKAMCCYTRLRTLMHPIASMPRSGLLAPELVELLRGPRSDERACRACFLALRACLAGEQAAVGVAQFEQHCSGLRQTVQAGKKRTRSLLKRARLAGPEGGEEREAQAEPRRVGQR